MTLAKRRKAGSWVRCTVLVSLVGTAAPALAGDKAPGPLCAGVWYQSVACECPAGSRCQGCPCASCTPGAACACVAALREGAGIIEGTVTHPTLGRLPLLVYVENDGGRTYQPPARAVELDQQKLTFLPRLLPVVRGTTVTFKNSDPMEHNVFSPDFEKYDLGRWGQGDVRTYTFDKQAGVYTQLCNLHPEMIAYIVVLDNPYFAVVSEPSGRFVIRNVPAGVHNLKVWGERLKPPQLAKVLKVEVKPGQIVTAAVQP